MYEVQDVFTFDSSSRQQSPERLTPHKFTIMCLAYEYHQLMLLQNKELDITLPDEQILSDTDKRVFMIMLLDLLQCPDMELKALREKIDPVLNECILENVYITLANTAQQGVKPMQDFLEHHITKFMVSASAPMDEGQIRRDSIMGLYVRRMLLAYHEMSFCQVVNMFHKIKDYYEAGFPESKKHNDQVMKEPSLCFQEPGALTMLHLEPKTDTVGDASMNKLNVFSKKQAEYFMAHQALMLGHNQSEALPPDQLQQRIKDILRANPDLAEAHFLSYMNSLRVKEYCTALHNLCHFFDRKACPPAESSPPKKKVARVEEIAMRYAALNLASLQFRFGNREECKAALQEAIMLAQEGNDQVCLQHALVWLNLLGESHSGVAQLERSFRKTIDLSLPNLTVHGLNCISKDLGMGTEKPSSVIYFFTQSNLINCMHSSYGMMAAGCAQRAAMWHYYGKRQLCSLDSHIVLHLETSINGVYYNGQAVCIAMCNLAQQHADVGDYAAAAEIISHAKTQFPASTSEADIWQACQQRVAFTRALYNGRLKEAEQAMINLQAVDKAEAKIRKGILLREQGKVTEALDCLVSLLAECDKEKSEYTADFRCRVLLEISTLYFSRGESTTAVLYVSDCVAQAARHHLELLEALATTHLAYIQLNMGLPKKALQLLETRLLRVFTHCGSYDKARVLHLYARCKVGVAKSELSAPVSEITADLQSAASLMMTVTTLYHSVEAHLKEKDALHFQAIVHHMLLSGGDRQHHQEERNRCSRLFKSLDRLYPTLGPAGVCVL